MYKKFCIYIKDESILATFSLQKNKSEYVERAIRFYEENKDIVAKLADALILETRKD